MGIPVLIMGKSGTGKTRSLKFFKKDELGVIKVIEKPLPFKSDLNTFTTKKYADIKALLLKSKTKSIVIDDAGYLLTSEFMDRSQEKGYDKYNELAFNFYDLIQYISTALPPEKIVYVVMHEEESEVINYVKPKTIGKLLDEKICIEGMFTIAIRCVIKNNNEHIFITNGNGAKSPEDMFNTEIENNLKLVDDKIREYYNV